MSGVEGRYITGTHVGALWSLGGQMLASATFANETATGWQQVNLSVPAITANTVYGASCLAPQGGYGAIPAVGIVLQGASSVANHGPQAMNPPTRIFCVAATEPDLSGSPFGPFVTESCASLDELAQKLCLQPCDAVLIQLPGGSALADLIAWPALSHAVLDAAVLVLVPEPDATTAIRLLQLGVQDVLPTGRAAVDVAVLGRALRLAVERKRLEQAARRAYATDLSTGLPNHAQLLEHMSHLAALREREPAPMALIVLRVEGLVAVAATLGLEAANVLRRKVAVRLRSGLRASDVVASIGADVFAVLLAWIDSPQDGERVAAKLATSLTRPFGVAGRELTLAVNAGLASYPEHGKDADSLLRRALGQAASLATVGRATVAQPFDRGPSAAANDE